MIRASGPAAAGFGAAAAISLEIAGFVPGALRVRAAGPSCEDVTAGAGIAGWENYATAWNVL
jgi:hypothetical protein